MILYLPIALYLHTVAFGRICGPFSLPFPPACKWSYCNFRTLLNRCIPGDAGSDKKSRRTGKQRSLGRRGRGWLRAAGIGVTGLPQGARGGKAHRGIAARCGNRGGQTSLLRSRKCFFYEGGRERGIRGLVIPCPSRLFFFVFFDVFILFREALGSIHKTKIPSYSNYFGAFESPGYKYVHPLVKVSRRYRVPFCRPLSTSERTPESAHSVGQVLYKHSALSQKTKDKRPKVHPGEYRYPA